jgi:glucose-6-phosphate isomerase
LLSKKIAMALSLNIEYLKDVLSFETIKVEQDTYIKAKDDLIEKNGKGNDFTGWLYLSDDFDNEEINKIKTTAKYLSQKETIVIIGIGGSYLGAKAIIEALGFNELTKKTQSPQIVYAGHHLSEDYHYNLLEYLKNKDYACVVISKSGTTTEPAIAFRLIKKQMLEMFPNDIAQRIYTITDKKRGALKEISDKEGYTRFVIPDDVGGRYSVLSPVGLLPIAAAGFDIDALLKGADDMKEQLFNENDFAKNPALMYAAIRNFVQKKGYTIELLSSFDPQLFYLMEWWKQLFGESDGKESKGLFPASAVYSTDLHSLGQFVQEGSPCIFETFLHVDESNHSLVVPEDEEDIDKLNYIKGKRLQEINHTAEKATALAHKSREMPILQIIISKIDAYHLGQLIFFFEFSCAVGAYAMGINPFNQPGVEAYKTKMFEILGKEGFVTNKI